MFLDLAPLKLRPYGVIQICSLLLLLFTAIIQAFTIKVHLKPLFLYNENQQLTESTSFFASSWRIRNLLLVTAVFAL